MFSSTAEIIGYAASVLVAVSLLMTSIVKLRIVNLFGCAAFVAYGAAIGSIPIVITNGFIALVNAVYLYRIFFRSIDPFDYIPMDPGRSAALEHFIREHLPDVTRHFPLFSPTRVEGGADEIRFLALRDFAVVGFAILSPAGDAYGSSIPEERELLSRAAKLLPPASCRYLAVDYIARPYRDMGVAKKLHEEVRRVLGDRVRHLLMAARRGDRRNVAFLRSHGFVRLIEGTEYDLFVKNLTRQ